MEIDLHRRQTLAGLAALAGLGAWAFAPASAFARNNGTMQLAAAWEREGSFHICLLSTQPGAGQPFPTLLGDERIVVGRPERHRKVFLPGASVLTCCGGIRASDGP